MLIAYFDESGHPQDKEVVSMAMVISTEKKWRLFEDKWSRRLRRDNIGIFHMTDYEHRRGNFAHLDNDHRLSLIVDLASILKTSIEFGVANSIVVKDWNEVLGSRWPDPFERKRATYIVLLQTCLEKIILNRFHVPNGESIACVFEENDFIAGAIQQAFLNLKSQQWFSGILGSMSFASKTELVPLQSADMLAFEAYKHILNQVVLKGKRPTRKLYRNLRLCNKIYGGYLDRKSLTNFLVHYTQNFGV